MRISWLAFVLGLLACAPPARAAKQFDVIYVDRITATIDEYQVGWGTGDYGFAIVVNTGSDALTAEDLRAAQFTATESVARSHFLPAIGSLSDYAPITTGQAVGSVVPYVSLLEGLVQPSETFINVAPVRALTYGMYMPAYNYAGSLHFDVTLTIGGVTVTFPLDVTVSQGEQFSVTNESARRVSSGTGSTVAAVPTSWGRVKALYR